MTTPNRCGFCPLDGCGPEQQNCPLRQAAARKHRIGAALSLAVTGLVLGCALVPAFGTTTGAAQSAYNLLLLVACGLWYGGLMAALYLALSPR